MNTATRKRRLTKLADYLKKVDRDSFNMSVWAIHNGEHKPEEDNYCGTAACALGHAAMIPSFRKAGLFLNWYLRDQDSPDNGWAAHVKFEGLLDEEAGGKFFGLTEREALDLFTDVDRSREEVIKLIRKLAKLPYKASSTDNDEDSSWYSCNDPDCCPH